MNEYPFPWYVKRPAWPCGVLLLVILVAVISWLLKRPSVPALPNVVESREDLMELLAIQQDRNEGIRQAIARTQEEIEQFSCPADVIDQSSVQPGAPSLPSGQESPGMTTDRSVPPKPQTPDNDIPDLPARIPELPESGKPSTEQKSPSELLEGLPQVTGAESPLKPSELRRQVTAAVVYIGAYKGNKGGSGTGFFISDNVVMTNAHVVDGKPDRIAVFSEITGQVSSAKIIGFDYGKTPGSRDYALLEVEDFKAPSVMSLTDNPASFMKVFTAGYPGVYGEVLEALNPDNLPDLVITDGIVSAIKITPQKVPAISHTASVYKGNSGGPLVNQCGSVVGINTFYVTPGRESAKIDFALGSADIRTFAESRGIRVNTLSHLCE